MLTRPIGFEESGRAQDEVQSVQIDLDIIAQFQELDIKYTQLESNDNAETAYNYIVKTNAH